MNDLRVTIRTAAVKALEAVVDFTARALVAATDWVTARSRVPNPCAAVRVAQIHLADQNLSGGDVIDELSWGLSRLGFTWPDGLCDGETEDGTCNAPLTSDDEYNLCAACAQREEDLAA